MSLSTEAQGKKIGAILNKLMSNLKAANLKLQQTVIELESRSMRDNVLFHGLSEAGVRIVIFG